MMPTIIYEHKTRYLFGLVEIHFYIEDRRPDLRSKYYNGRYKHWVSIKAGWNSHLIVIRSDHVNKDNHTGC